ncbi:MAG: F0F1 ATP synthase subunit delta [Proteiniphilum sp.]|nr:F0F1 ATP synthase subunit delta [Proteiniphilum sp.]MDD4415756.1 F0F1 ATP synthase subunit delta [Proteiniphilum sp.]
MNTGLISTRYATALLDYSQELGQHEEVYEKMHILSSIYLKVPQLRFSIQNRSVHPRAKKSIIITACGGDVPSSLRKMIDLILKNERHEQIQYIALRFIELYRERFNIRHGKLITAIAIDEEKCRRLTSRFEKIVGGKLEVENVEDPDIIGGFILSLNDYRWDASVSGELSRIRRVLQD